MKILMVNKFLYPNGGAETYMFRLGKHLQNLGHEVEYFGMQHKDNCVANSANAYTGSMDFHNSGALQKIAMSFKTIYSKEARQKIRLVLEDFCPDVVHLNNFNYQLTPSIILEIRKWERESGRSVKIIYTAHDYQLICPNHMLNTPSNNKNCEECIGGKFINCTKNKCIHSSTLKSIFGTLEAEFWSRKNTYREIDRIICCSDFMKSKLDTSNTLRSKTVTLHNFNSIEESKKYEKKDYILYFGRYAEEKGIRPLIEASKRLAQFEFVFAGSGPLENELNDISNIKNVGFKSGEELYRLIGEAKISVYPSTWYENCPYSVMESISLGTPVVGADIGGIPELIDDGKTGVLFTPADCDSLTKAIEGLCSNEEAYSQIANNCSKDCFISIDEYTQKYLEIIQG